MELQQKTQHINKNLHKIRHYFKHLTNLLHYNTQIILYYFPK